MICHSNNPCLSDHEFVINCQASDQNYESKLGGKGEESSPKIKTNDQDDDHYKTQHLFSPLLKT